MYLKGLLVAIATLYLSGCASYIANKVTSLQDNHLSGNIMAVAEQITLCGAPQNCFSAYLTGQAQTALLNLSFSFHGQNNATTWRFKSDTKTTPIDRPLTNDLIVIFTGYGQNWQILYLHQLWLEHISGAQVMVIPSANHSSKFQFGLNYVVPVVAEIKRRSSRQVHILGFSMGAVAAQQVANQLDNARLHLIAPMTNFLDSANSIWQMQEQNNWLLKLVPKTTLNNARDKVIGQSGVSISDIAILSNIQTTPMFVYLSDADDITRASDWDSKKHSDVTFFRYLNLDHIQMIGLADPRLMKDFVGNLFGNDMSEQELQRLVGSFSYDD